MYDVCATVVRKNESSVECLHTNMTHLTCDSVRSPSLKSLDATAKTPKNTLFRVKNPYVTGSPSSERPVKRSSVCESSGPSFQRFFSALLRSSVSDYFEASFSNYKEKSKTLWDRICYRLGINIICRPIRSKYSDLPTHCIARASLVVEEARHEISTALSTIYQRQQKELRPPEEVVNGNRTVGSLKSSPDKHFEIILEVQNIEACGNDESSCKVCFRSENPFTSSELDAISPGSVFVCSSKSRSQPQLNPTESSFLGVVAMGTFRKNVKDSQAFTMEFFSQKDITNVIQSQSLVSVTHISQLGTIFRCYVALTSNYNIHFASHLLGTGTHILSNPTELFLPPSSNRFKCDSADFFYMPELNLAQDDAAVAFLHSSPNTITLIQGPPGTGKTSLLVSIICRYLVDSVSQREFMGACKFSCNRKLVVAAPTNKAVAVLATRFMNSLKSHSSIQFNAILVGDADKLFPDKGNGDGTIRALGDAFTGSDHNGLKSIFLYTWIQNITKQFSRILAFLMPDYRGFDTPPILYRLAVQLRQRMTGSLLHLPVSVVTGMNDIIQSLDSIRSSRYCGPNTSLSDDVEKLIDELRMLDEMTVVEQVSIRFIHVPWNIIRCSFLCFTLAPTFYVKVALQRTCNLLYFG